MNIAKNIQLTSSLVDACTFLGNIYNERVSTSLISEIYSESIFIEPDPKYLYRHISAVLTGCISKLLASSVLETAHLWSSTLAKIKTFLHP